MNHVRLSSVTYSRRVLGWLLTVCVLIGLLTASVSALNPVPSETGPAPQSAEPFTDYYGYAQLTDEGEKGAYRAMLEGCLTGTDADRIDLSPYRLTPEAFIKVYDILSYDHPELYRLSPAVKYGLDETETYVTCFQEACLPQSFDHVAFLAQSQQLLKAAEGKTTEYEQALAIHDALARRVVYDLEAPNIYNAYGAIVDGRAVCEGYAEAYQYLLQQLGIQSYVAVGWYYVDGVEGDAHAWNLVRLDGQYYYVDLTWDDQLDSPMETVEEPIYYGYFCLSTQDLLRDHKIEDLYGILPDCPVSRPSPACVVVDRLDIPLVATAIRPVGDYAVGRIFYTGEGNIVDWLLELSDNGQPHLLEAIYASGIYGTADGQVCMMGCGQEFYFYYEMEPGAHVHHGSLVHTPPTTEYEGVEDYYMCTCGRYFEDEACTVEITDLPAWVDAHLLPKLLAPESDTTSAPETTTAEPETTVIEPETTTPAPETTEPEPETTTQAPETTATPNTTEPEPETTVTPPETTNPEPETTTAAPETTAPAPETTTRTPETLVTAPAATTPPAGESSGCLSVIGASALLPLLALVGAALLRKRD